VRYQEWARARDSYFFPYYGPRYYFWR